MRVCTQCELSIGETASFCPVCGTLAEGGHASPTPAPLEAPGATERPAEGFPQELLTRGSADAPAAVVESAPEIVEDAPSRVLASDHESEARRCEKTDMPRAVALYRQAIVEYLESSSDPLESRSVRRNVQRVFDRLSLMLKRSGRLAEALEEIDDAARLGLVDDEECGTKTHREALVKRRAALRRELAKGGRSKR